MKKSPLLLLLAGTLIITAGALTYYIVFQKNNAGQASQTSVSTFKDACDILSEESAKTILGESITKADSSNNANASSNDIVVSQCMYSEMNSATGVLPQAQKSAGIIIRRPLTESGKEANKAVFIDGAMPKNAENVIGYGEKAFWNSEYGQLNILKNDSWYILEYGPLVPSNRNLPDTKKFADILISSL